MEFQTSFNRSSSEDLVGQFNTSWARNESIAQENAAIKMGSAKTADYDKLRLAGLVGTQGATWVQEIDKKQKNARLAEQKMSMYLDILFGDNTYPSLAESNKQDREFVKGLKQSNREAVSQNLKQGVPFSDNYDYLVAEGDEGYWLAQIKIKDAFSKYDQYLTEDPTKGYVIPGGNIYTREDRTIGMQEHQNARLSDLNEFFLSQPDILEASASDALPYMEELVKHHRAWQHETQIKVDDIKSQTKRDTAWGTYKIDGDLSELIADWSITTSGGKTLGYDGAMDLLIQQQHASTEATGEQGYVEGVKLKNTPISPGHKGYGINKITGKLNTYADIYPNRFGLKFDIASKEALNKFNTREDKFKKNNMKALRLDDIKNIETVVKDQNLNAAQELALYKKLQKERKYHYGNDYNDDIITERISYLESPPETITQQNALSILEYKAQNGSLSAQHDKDLILLLPFEDQKPWFTRAADITKIRRGDQYQSYHKQIKDNFLRSNVLKRAGDQFLKSSQLPIVLELQTYFQAEAARIRNQGKLTGEIVDPNIANLTAYNNTMDYLEANSLEGKRYHQATAKDDENGIELGDYHNFDASVELESITAYREGMKFERNLIEKKVQYKTTQNLFSKPEILFTKNTSEQWEDGWGKPGYVFPTNVRIAAKDLGFTPHDFVNAVRVANGQTLLPLPYQTMGGKEYNELVQRQTAEASNRYIAKWIHNGEKLENTLPAGFGQLALQYNNPPLVAAILERTNLFNDFNVNDLDDLDSITEIIQDDPNLFLQSLPTEDVQPWLVTLWKYQVPGFEQPPINPRLRNTIK